MGPGMRRRETGALDTGADSMMSGGKTSGWARYVSRCCSAQSVGGEVAGRSQKKAALGHATPAEEDAMKVPRPDDHLQTVSTPKQTGRLLAAHWYGWQNIPR
jgi:hypothetical protein